MADHLGRHGGAGDGGLADVQHAVVVHQEHPIERECFLQFLFQQFDPQDLALGHSVLLATGLNHCVHDILAKEAWAAAP